ncbi:hypothetical protein ACFVVM_20175 [Nocardia sp. NPDC058176]|uniref:hypothetical protein n=1 Tax=Nocardia sp. NPDC058176 TaxID=3346368 RepID=UPI0036DCC2B0
MMFRRRTVARRYDPIWNTFPDEYTILLVARTLTSTYRLLEAAQWLRDDFRVKPVFTIDDASAFSTGVPELLRDKGVEIVPWSHVTQRRFPYHLALAASENVDFAAIHSRTILLPHGLGFNKFLPSGRRTQLRLAGLPSERALRTGKVIIALSHPDQREQLRATSPRAAACAETVGDPTFDRLLASRSLRDRYRRAMDTGDRILITLASTWGPESLIGRGSTLPARLLGALPLDSYQVVTVLHPNVWARYGEYAIELWLASALDAGLILMPPEAGWHAALIAADQVISDQGSLGLFAASLDLPLLTVGRSTETVPGTPADDLAAAVGTLGTDGDLRRKLDEARRSHRPGRYRPVTDRVFAEVGDAATNVQRLIYRELGLSPLPDATPLRRIPVPRCRTRPVTTCFVETRPIVGATLELVRFPASVDRYADQRADTHLVAAETEPDPKLLERAAAITHDRDLDEAAGVQWARSALSEYPGARLAVTPTVDGALAVVRDGTVIRATVSPVHPARAEFVASALYCGLIGQHPLDGPIAVRAGHTVIEVTFTRDRAVDPVRP